MDISQKLNLSYYKNIATLNESHHIFLAQHQETQKIFVKKILSIYNLDVYKTLMQNPISGIPTIVDFFENDNQLTVIENYISGQSLEDIIKTKVLDLQTILHYALELCSVLSKLHNMSPSIVHRDIKPSNIIITEYNHVVLIDFNAAKFYSDESSTDTILLGTKGYAAPEQYGFGSSSPKTDIYGLGILLKELTSSLAIVPHALMEIIEKCIKISPSDRYSSVAELEIALKSMLVAPKHGKKQTSSINKYLLPGFRTHTIWKMLLAIPSYLFIFLLSVSVDVENTYGASLVVTRIFIFLIFMSIILNSFNYLNIHEYFPLCKHENRIIRFLGIFIFDLLILITLFIILVIILTLFFER